MANLSIKQWAKDDRPREKLITKGPGALSNAELIALLIHTGRKDKSAVEIARELLLLGKNDLGKLGKLSPRDFMKVTGIGNAKAISLAAALELGRRRQSIQSEEKEPVVKCSMDAVNILQPLLMDHCYEVFVVLYLNAAGVVKHIEWLSKGGIDHAAVDVRIILRIALEQQATRIILCHNHPSGSLIPSQADIELTQRVHRAAGQIEIALLDHVIVSDKGHTSLADKGLLEPS